MKLFHRNLLFLTGLATTLNCQRIDPAFSMEQRYKHDLFSSEAECLRWRRSNAEFNCSETVLFKTNGQADILFGGGDLIIRSHYQRKAKTITLDPIPGLPNRIEFTVVSDTELVEVNNGSRWQLY